jgi:DNA-binding Lrp family transcriptional regulator
LTDIDRALLAHAARGLKLIERPFAAMARAVGIDEDAAIARLRALKASGAIKRMGLIVRHRELGYRANAMVVWDVAEDRVDDLGRRMAAFPFVTLCYRRRRAPPRWPFNLFAMIHGVDRMIVLEQIDQLATELDLRDTPRAVLFSGRRFKQRGARYDVSDRTAPAREASWTTSIAAS